MEIEAGLFVRLEFRPVALVRHFFDERENLYGGQRAHEFGCFRLAVDAEDGADARRQVYVARLVLDHRLENELDADAVHAVFSARAPPDFGQREAMAKLVERFDTFFAGRLVFRGATHRDAVFLFDEAAVCFIVGGDGFEGL